MTDVRVVLCTAPAAGSADRPGADDLARQLVEERLCACVNVLPGVRSFFRWDGAVDVAEERLLVIKSTVGALPALRVRVQQLHPYQVPEFLELAVADGLPAYLDWVRASVARGQ